MKVHINQIPPEGAHLEGEEPSEILDLNDPEIRPLGPIHYWLDAGLSGGGLFATGRLSIDFEFQCVNCLDRFAQRVLVDPFACQVDLTGAETVDLTEPIREDILLALPPHPRCDWNGERTCRGAFPTQTEAEETAPASDVWGALDQLKLKKKH
jgi:uncharacterized metal-binding protein YceD (DUF177 family)